MTEENLYSRVMKKKEINELEDYVLQNEHYQDDAVIAAIWELGQRGISSPRIELLKETLSARIIPSPSVPLPSAAIQRKPYLAEGIGPKLFDPNAVLVFGALFSVLGGAVLMALNLKQLGKTKSMALVVGLALVFSIVQSTVLSYIQVTHPLITTLISLIGMALLHQFVWKKQVANPLAYQTRSMWIPVLIAVALGLLVFYALQKTGLLQEMGVEMPG